MDELNWVNTMPNAVMVWTEPKGAIVPKDASTAPAIAGAAKSLSKRDVQQIVTAFDHQAYEMMSGFVLNKALSQLKRQLANLGMEFVGEMLGRPDLDEDSVPTVSISDYEAINLARELGIVTSTDAVRLTHHLELLAHFDGLDPHEAEAAEMTQEEAVAFLRTCVNAVLGREGDFAPIEFVEFRASLENRTFKKDDGEVGTLTGAPYFFRKTTLSILLSNVKTRSGAQFEHTLGNFAVVVPAMWPGLRDTEKWAVGQAYAEAVNAGRSAAVIAIKKALTAVRGFDFVPETLRSSTFSAAASDILRVHSGLNNYYNEPSAIAALAKLGSTIPWPAFPVCLSAILAVGLGNSYGHAWLAQSYVDGLLERLSANQWEYYLNECLPTDELILQKILGNSKPRERWLALVEDYSLADRSLKNINVRKLVDASKTKNDIDVRKFASKLISEFAQLIGALGVFKSIHRSRWIGSIHPTSSGGSTGSMVSMFTTTASLSERTSTHSRGFWGSALISWWGT